MAKRTYAEKLRDPRWQKKRLKILERDKFKCCRCKSSKKTLNVHHGYYEWGKDPWDYEDWTLSTVCEDCHLIVQKELQQISKTLTLFSLENLPTVNRMLSIIANFNDDLDIEFLFYFKLLIEEIEKLSEPCVDFENGKREKKS